MEAGWVQNKKSVAAAVECDLTLGSLHGTRTLAPAAGVEAFRRRWAEGTRCAAVGETKKPSG